MAYELELRIQEILRECQRRKGLDWAKELFYATLGFDRVNDPLPIPDQVRSLATGDSSVFASKGDFKILYICLNSETLRLTDEKKLANILLQAYPYSLFVFSNREQGLWHLVNTKPLSQGGKGLQKVYRRITIGPHERLRTAVERLALLNVDASNLSAMDVQAKCDQVFDVERVTKDFYRGYVGIFNTLQKILVAQSPDPTSRETTYWAHDYALQMLNRIMFLYFVQRKQWIGGNPAFIKDFWDTYSKSGRPRNTFFSEWLQVLFFEAFNKKLDTGEAAYRERFTPEILSALSDAPYLNGGLFTPNDLDKDPAPAIPDAFFASLFDEFQGDTPGFFERYNFTISEDTPLDQEVAVDPEMIGRVYESLVNVTSEGISDGDQRGDAGIFYTPRVEIDLMCRLAVVDRLSNEVGKEERPFLYQMVFAYEPDDKTEADRLMSKQGLWSAVDKVLRGLTVVDPACGSGSFLVGMLLVLDDLIARCNKALGREESPYHRRKGIISRNLYGVDVMPWAVQVAELRLWLQLVVETEITEDVEKGGPILPSLSFNIRPGDTLLQEVSGVNFGAKYRVQTIRKPSLLKKVTDLKAKKMGFSLGITDCVSEKALKEEEKAVFLAVLQDRRSALRDEITEISGRREQAVSLFGEGIPQQPVLSAAEAKAAKEAELSVLTKVIDDLSNGADPPFVWDLAFVEIFSGDSHGFDIVIGNPPYVRQEKIADPAGRMDKAVYKEKIGQSVATAWPRFFQTHKMDGQSDLYLYFYFYCSSLLAPNGTFCFITSNSWLDASYGRTLQEFLLRHSHVRVVIDNRVERSFAQADINTVIVLFPKPDDNTDSGLCLTARFVTVKVPFEEVLSPIVFSEIDETKDTQDWPEFRCIAKGQRELYSDGFETIERRGQMISRYIGDKWGGKYLRAPEVYFRIVAKAGSRLVPLKEIADVSLGVKSGANDFFFVRVLAETPDHKARIRCDDGSEHEIDSRCVRQPIVTKAREILKPRFVAESLPYRLVQINNAAAKLPEVARYIAWGRSQGYHSRPAVRTRDPWFDIGTREPVHLLVPIGHKRRPVVAIADGMYGSNNLVEVRLHNPAWTKAVAASIFSSFTLMLYEVFGRANFGQGLLKTETYEVGNLLVVNPDEIPQEHLRELEEAFDRISDKEPLMLYDEIRLEGRRRLDNAFLYAIGFSIEREREPLVACLQDTACRLIWRRLAKSGNARESRQTYDEWLATGTPFGVGLEDESEESPEESE